MSIGGSQALTLNRGSVFRDEGLSNADFATFLPRHRWYLVKEAFSPHLVEAAIRAHACETSLVLDPFSGSGTVALTCAENRVASIGIEVNPFLAFLARAKLLQVSNTRFREGAEDAREGFRTKSPSSLESFSTFVPRRGRRGLFQREILRAFDGAWDRSMREPPKVRDLTRLALLGAAMDCCNAVRDGKCLRYRKGRAEHRFTVEEFDAAFRDRVGVIAMDLELLPIRQRSNEIRLGDARDLVRTEEAFNLIVTSPPYLNSFDYTDVYRPELFLGRFVTSMAELRSLRQRTLRSHLQTAWKSPVKSDFGRRYSRVIKRLLAAQGQLWNKRLPLMVQAYFEDMQTVLESCYRLMRRGGGAWLVVSTSSYGGNEIPVDFILAEIAERIGWRVRDIELLRVLRTAGQQWRRFGTHRPPLRESLVVLERAR